jgi:hypothetical protein
MLRPALTLFAFLALACAPRGSPPPRPPTGLARWEPPRVDADRRTKFEKLVPELDTILTEDQRANGAPGGRGHRPGRRNGKRATFLLSCQESPVELTIALEPSGKIAQATGRAPRVENRPNCAD